MSNKLKKLLDESDINERVVDKIYHGLRRFYGSGYNYRVTWLNLDRPFLKNCQVAEFNKKSQMSYSNIEQIIPFFSKVSSKTEEFSKLFNKI